MAPGPVLALKNITKSLYDVNGRTINKDIVVLNSVDFDVRKGEVHVLLGENGAGKSTLVKILCGAIPADSGHIEFNGERVSVSSTQKAHSLGVRLVAQEFSLCPNLSVAANISLGKEMKTRRLKSLDSARMEEEAVRQLERLKVKIDVRKAVEELSVAQQQMVEIAKALSMDPHVLILDEPTSALADDQIQKLFSVLRDLTAKGISIVYISHKLNEVFEIGDRITVLRDGSTVGTTVVGELKGVDELVQMMIGQKLDTLFHRSPVAPGETVLEVKGLSVRNVLENIDLSIRAGEIVGIAGIIGAGRTELARAIFGIDKTDAGEIYIKNRLVRKHGPIRMIRLGVGLLPEDRKRQGIVPLSSVAENVCQVVMSRLSYHGLIGIRRRRRTTAEKVKELDISVSSVNQELRYLSGGNQQKVVLAKWLCAKPDVFIFDEPTRGIDVGAKAAIYGLMDGIVRRGGSILMISSELQEVVGMSDRIYVMRKGKIVKELKKEEFAGDTILRYAMAGETFGS
jgi:ribose transport system ATP-binding protein